MIKKELEIGSNRQAKPQRTLLHPTPACCLPVPTSLPSSQSAQGGLGHPGAKKRSREVSQPSEGSTQLSKWPEASRKRPADNGRGAGDHCPQWDKLGQQPGLQLGAGGEQQAWPRTGTIFCLLDRRPGEAFGAEAVEGVGFLLLNKAGPTMQALAGVTEVTCNDSPGLGTNHSLSKYLGRGERCGQLPGIYSGP